MLFSKPPRATVCYSVLPKHGFNTALGYLNGKHLQHYTSRAGRAGGRKFLKREECL